MSAYTSLRVTRSKAVQELVKRLLQDANDKRLEEFMDNLLAPRLYNAVIVPDGAPNDDELV
jgi:hypothetical protein